MREHSKAVRRRLRELAGLAHERELNQHLDVLFGDFHSWKRGEMNPFDLSDRIHQFHQKPARDLYVLYRDQDLEFLVARAVANRLISREEVGESILPLLERTISFLQDA